MIENKQFPPVYNMDIPHYLNGIKKVIKDNLPKIEPYLNFESVMQYGGEFRGDLLEEIKTPKGEKWMKAFIKIVKFTLKHIELSPEQRTRLFIKRMKEIHNTKLQKIQQPSSVVNDNVETLNKLETIESEKDQLINKVMEEKYGKNHPLSDLY